MPKKTIPNTVSIHRAEDVLSCFTFSKKNYYASESKLYDALDDSINKINPNYSVHLTTYPYIAVHVSFGLHDGLSKDRERLEQTVLAVLRENLRQT